MVLRFPLEYQLYSILCKSALLHGLRNTSHSPKKITVEYRLTTIDPGHLEEILAVGHPLLLSLLKDMERLLEEGGLTARDAIIAYGVVSDKIGC